MSEDSGGGSIKQVGWFIQSVGFPSAVAIALIVMGYNAAQQLVKAHSLFLETVATQVSKSEKNFDKIIEAQDNIIKNQHTLGEAQNRMTEILQKQTEIISRIQSGVKP